MDSRRKVLQKIGLGTAAASLVVAGAQSLEAMSGSTAPRGAAPGAAGAVAGADPAAGAGPWWLLAPLGRGAHLGGGWFLAHLGPVEKGAAVLTLQHQDGAVASVHLCHHVGSPRGLASTELIDMILMDGGQGEKPTDERLGRVLMGLAQVVRGNELRGDGDLAMLAQMQPHAERVLAHGPESLS